MHPWPILTSLLSLVRLYQRRKGGGGGAEPKSCVLQIWPKRKFSLGKFHLFPLWNLGPGVLSWYMQDLRGKARGHFRPALHSGTRGVGGGAGEGWHGAWWEGKGWVGVFEHSLFFTKFVHQNQNLSTKMKNVCTKMKKKFRKNNNNNFTKIKKNIHQNQNWFTKISKVGITKSRPFYQHHFTTLQTILPESKCLDKSFYQHQLFFGNLSARRCW